MMLTVSQAADILGISPRRVLQLIATRRIKATRIGPDSRGGQWLISRAALKRVAERPGPGRPRKST
jgi:excisionase family DNA binding protein